VLLSGLESLGPTKYKLYNEDCVSPLTVGSLENAKHCPNYDIYIYIYNFNRICKFNHDSEN
jgi:hypothetical protein